MFDLARTQKYRSKYFDLTGSAVNLGRHPDKSSEESKNIQIANSKISRTHLTFTPEFNENGRLKVFVVDRSTNGAWLNNARLKKNTRYQLKSGDMLSLVFPYTKPSDRWQCRNYELEQGSLTDRELFRADVYGFPCSGAAFHYFQGPSPLSARARLGRLLTLLTLLT